MTTTFRLLVGLLALSPVAASADPISVFYDFRNTAVEAAVQDASGFDRHTGNAYQTDTLESLTSASTGTSSAASGASLSSDLSNPTHLWGSGVAAASFDTEQMADTSAAATYYVGLHLEQPYSFAFDGAFASTGRSPFDPTGPNVSGRWNAQLFQRNGSYATFAMDASSYDAMSLGRTGTLTAGDWYLLVEAAATGYTPRAAIRSSLAQYVFTMDLAPVTAPSPTPEPASMLLLGTGVAGLFAANRRR